MEGSGVITEHTGAARKRSPARSWTIVPFGTAALVSIGILVYAVTNSFVWDEGFHLVAAQLIAHGKRPYLDFCFPQTPLNAYWNAAWMRLFGERWQITHVAAALLLIGTLFLVARFTLESLPISRWRAGCATIAVLFVGASITVVKFGPIAQAYAICLFCSFAAFFFTIECVERGTAVLAAPAGMLAGIAAGSSLLSAPVAPVLAAWIFFRSSRRSAALAWFVAGAAVPILPIVWLFVQGPHQTWFNIVAYQALFRRVDWDGATPHDVDVLTTWIDTGQALIAAILSALALLLMRGSDWTSRFRQRFSLAAWIAAALIVYISTAHPTFSRYYVVAIPFIAVLTAPGFYFAASRIFRQARPLWPTLALSTFLLLALARFLFNERDSATWRRYEELAHKVAAVTPKGAIFFADEHLYFLLHIAPPPGMEFSYSHKLTLPRAEEARLHIISEPELKQNLASGIYASFESCNDDRVDDWKVATFYKHRADIDDCSVFWDFQRKRGEPGARQPLKEP